MDNLAPTPVNSLSQLKAGQKIENSISGEQFVVLANYGTRVVAVESVTLVTVNDHAHKEWFCASSDQPLNKLKVGDIITHKQTFVITSVSEFILHANRCVEITNPREYLLIS
jgi:hypothetical protein